MYVSVALPLGCLQGFAECVKESRQGVVSVCLREREKGRDIRFLRDWARGPAVCHVGSLTRDHLCAQRDASLRCSTFSGVGVTLCASVRLSVLVVGASPGGGGWGQDVMASHVTLWVAGRAQDIPRVLYAPWPHPSHERGRVF